MRASRSRSTDQRYYGVAEALVTENAGDPEQEGRIKVTFPWFNGEMVSEWCRVAQFYAGGGYGSFFIPEVGDEVLVAFVHGDMRMPIIIGGLYNGQDKPSTSRETDKDQKLIRTKGGHEVLLEDTSGSEKIAIVDSKTSNKIVIDTANDTITIEASSDITIKSAQGKLLLTGNGIEMRSQAGIKVEATANLDLKGATINLN